MYNQSGDYITAYKCSYKCAKMSNSTIERRAKQLLAMPKVQNYIASLTPDSHLPKGAFPSHIDTEKLTAMLLNAYEKAAEDKRGASAMISACLAIAKLNDIDEGKNITGNNTISKDLSALIKEARARLTSANKTNAE